MGKAARRERQQARTGDRPEWAGAFGFQRAWKVNERYLRLAQTLLEAEGPAALLQAEQTLMGLRLQMLGGDVRTLEQAADVPQEQEEFREAAEEVAAMTQRLGNRGAPGGPPTAPLAADFDAAGFLEQLEAERSRTARALTELAESHRRALRATTPIRFDPLDLPAVDSSTLVDVRLPFPTVTCDFLTQWGMSMPVVDCDGNGRWVGLVAATLQESASGIDVWPVVTTLRAQEADDRQSPTALQYGRVRLGSPLPEAPEGLVRVSIDEHLSAWVLELCGEPSIRANLWLDLPARAACAALQLLDAVNVSLQPAHLDRSEQRRAARFGAEPAREVVIRAAREHTSTAGSGGVDYQHRWTVRGHPKHYTRGSIFDANPQKRITIDGVECVKIWCPAFVKGPQDKPLVLKSRRVVAPAEQTQAGSSESGQATGN
jgi:hypothetical protein